MQRKTGLLTAGWSILMMAVGCSSLKDDLPVTVGTLDSAACETCHSLLPKTENHYEHILDTATLDSVYKKLLPLGCEACHRGYDDQLGWRDKSKHRNGIVDTITEECDYCHEVRRDCGWCHSIPPDQTEKQQKVHRHVTEQNYACGVCHPGYDYARRIAPPATHRDSTINVRFDGTPKKPGSPTNPYYENGVCYNLYCHGAVTPGGKQAVAISDVQLSGPAQCDFCHATEVLQDSVVEHDRDGHKTLFLDCNNCHEAGFSYNQMTVVDTSHIWNTVDTSHSDNSIDTSMALCRDCHPTLFQ